MTRRYFDMIEEGAIVMNHLHRGSSAVGRKADSEEVCFPR